MWTKTMESTALNTQKPIISTGLTDLEKREVDRLREENVTLRQALEQVGHYTTFSKYHLENAPKTAS